MILALLLICAAAQADVRLPRFFSNHMVLQRGMKVPVWGWANPDEKVTVTIGANSQTVTTDTNGRWRVEMPAMEPGEPTTVTVAGKNSITINDVLVGEVWLCSGQSNMEWPLSRAANGRAALAAANRPALRLFQAKRDFNEKPQDDVISGRWAASTAATARNFSAVGYFFAVELQQKLNVPVGLIEADVGGTRAEAWMPIEIFESLKLPYEPKWTEEMVQLSTPPGATQPVAALPMEAPGVLFNAMIHPLAGYAMRGALWYQGESNAPHPEKYYEVLSAMIHSWRDAWKQGDFPFLIVQLANYNVSDANDIQGDGLGGGWPNIRKAQTRVAADLPNAGMAVTIDIGESKNIHPGNKAEVGRRLFLAARKIAYHEEIEFSGPKFTSLQIDGDKAILTFTHADGLKSKTEQIEGFEIAGEDGKFVPAEATIAGDKVTVSSDQVTAPKSVRYAWDDDPKCSLYNSADLPAEPFGADGK